MRKSFKGPKEYLTIQSITDFVEYYRTSLKISNPSVKDEQINVGLERLEKFLLDRANIGKTNG